MIAVDHEGDKPRALLQQRFSFRSSLLNLRHPLVVTRIMDGRGVVPTLSSDDVKTAAQVLHSILPAFNLDRLPRS